ncbi:MAG: VOC family protein [Solirubrobacterales bacterium]|nr:VOC family protein [Solirubrobacterales bacterium]
MPAQPVPPGMGGPIPSLSIDGAAEAIDFYSRVFGARERGRMEGPDGKVAHALIEIGDSSVMLADAFPQSSCRPPTELGGTSVSVFLYVEDVDAIVEQAVDAGATLTMPVDDMFWGDRYGRITDPFGHQWEIATHVEDVDPEEMERRGREAMAGMG